MEGAMSGMPNYLVLDRKPHNSPPFGKGGLIMEFATFRSGTI